MTALPKTLVIAILAMLAVLAGAGIYEARQATQLRNQVQKLQQEQASLSEQVQQLKQQHKETQHQLADIRKKPKPQPHVRTTIAVPPSFTAPATLPSDMLETDLEQAYAEPSPGRREMALKKINQTISSKDIPRALAFLAKRPGMNGVQSPLFSGLASKWGGNDPDAASAWANSLSNPDTRKAALVGVLKGWADKDPDAAAAYAATLTPKDVQEAAVLKVVGEWSFRHASGAANWVAKFPPGELRDKAMGPIVFWGAGQCPATIADMLDATGDPKIIRKYGERVAIVWLQRDKPAARLWIKTSPLTEKVKQRLLKFNN